MAEISMDVSIIICTYNRSKSLRRTLEHIGEMSNAEDIKWELIVVDNNSKDNTEETVEQFIATSNVSCKYVLEKNQGQAFARNCGISNASGEIIVFTDDDVIVDKRWLVNIAKAFRNNNVACVGGKILPVWEKPRPKWLTGVLLDYIALCDLGEQEIALCEPLVWGANLSIKASMFGKYGYFDTSLGHKGGKLYGGEEVKFLQGLLEAGERIMYCPDILVYHCIPDCRLKKSYFRRWKCDKGELHGIQIGECKNKCFFGIPLYILRRTFSELIMYVRSKIFAREDAFQNELTFFFHIGIIRGRIKHTKEKRLFKWNPFC